MPLVMGTLGKDFVNVKLDTDRMVNGKQVAAELTGGRSTGMPWMVILDAGGKELVNSDGPEGNVGCPVTEAEADWFFEMLGRTRRRLSDEDLALVREQHDLFAAPILQRSR